MGALLDVLGSVIIAGMLILMIMTFQLQLQETATRLHYTGSMIEHMDTVSRTLNHTFAMAGIGIPVDSVCVVADTSRVAFRTYWNVASDTLSHTRHLIDIALDESSTEYGRVLLIKQDGSTIEPLGHIMYIENFKINYYDINDALTTSIGEVRSAEILLTFRRDSPWRPNLPLRSNIQLKCYFMNSYLQGG
jgi:hypothetical protein